MTRPAPRPSISGRDWAVLTLALVALCVANGRWVVAPAAWLGPLLLLVFIRRQPVARGLGLAFAAQLAAFFVSWRGLIPVPGMWYYLVAGIYAAVYFVPFVLHRVVARRLSGLASTLVFPASWVAVEFLFQRWVTPYGSWASLAYTQTGFLPLIQLASVTGTSGVTFLLTWFAAVGSGAARITERRRPHPWPAAGLVTYAAVLLACLVWGQWRLLSAPRNAPLLRVAMVTPAAALDRELQSRMAADPDGVAGLEIADRLNRDLLERTRAAAGAGADVVAWSEHAARVTRRTEPRVVDDARSIARSFGVPLVLGIGLWDRDSEPSFENKAVLIDGDGILAGTYLKAYPIVGQESHLIERGGGGIATMPVAQGLLGIVICHDLDFPEYLRTSAAAPVTVVFGPSSDWAAIEDIHARMAILRAVENGWPLVRPTSNGLSLAVDPLGRIVASQLDRGRDGNTLTAQVELFRRKTVYPVIGDLLAWVCLLALVFLVVSAARAGARAGSRVGGESE